MVKTEGAGAVYKTATQGHTGPGSPGSNYSYLDSYFYRYSDGVDTPNYHARKRRGDLIPPTPWYQTEHDYRTIGSVKQIHPNGVDVYTMATPPPDIGVDDIKPHDTNELEIWFGSLDATPYVQAAIAALYTRGFDGLTFAVELGKTVNMFRGVVDRLGNLLQSTDSKDWANAWLEGRYGWRILQYDIKDLSQLMAGTLVKEYEFYTQRVGASVDLGTHIKTYTHSYGGIYSFDYTRTSSVKGSVRGWCASKIRPQLVRYDLALTTWEVIPFSFVVDWIFSIGASLEMQAALEYHSDLVSSAGVLLEVATTGEVTSVTDYGGWQNEFIISSTGKTVFTQRGTGSSQTTINPQLRLNLDNLKVADLAALIRQRL